MHHVTQTESTRPAEVNDVLMNYLERTTGHRDVWKDMIRNDTMLLPWKGIPYYVGDAENQTVSQQLYGNLPNSYVMVMMMGDGDDGTCGVVGKHVHRGIGTHTTNTMYIPTGHTTTPMYTDSHFMMHSPEIL